MCDAMGDNADQYYQEVNAFQLIKSCEAQQDYCICDSQILPINYSERRKKLDIDPKKVGHKKILNKLLGKITLLKSKYHFNLVKQLKYLFTFLCFFF